MKGERQPIVVIVGPTAAGKSDLGVHVARELGGEIISADSMQVYRGFDIGTGKLPMAERDGVAHHLIDICDGHERFSAARFVELADEAIAAIQHRGGVAVVVGGTGLYVRALLRGLFEAPLADPVLRAELEAVRANEGVAVLYERLVAVDPVSAQRVHPNDFVRICRAIEVYQQTGRPVSAWRDEHGFGEARYSAVTVGLRLAPERLRERIESRVDHMIAGGWLEEVQQLIDAGYRQAHPMGALGYRQLAASIEGQWPMEEAIRLTKRDTWRFARRQRNWFSHDEPVTWVTAGEAFSVAQVAAQLRELAS